MASEAVVEGSEATAASTEVAAAAAAAETGSKHKLDRKWTFWFDNQSKPKQGAAWGTSLRKVYTFETVEEFWCLYDQIFKPSKLPGNADFHLFKAGIEPKWEDPECANGGKWTAACSRKTNLDSMWLETLMALIGEQFDESDDICGVVASVRQRQDKLSLWTKTAANEAAQLKPQNLDSVQFEDRSGVTIQDHDGSVWICPFFWEASIWYDCLDEQISYDDLLISICMSIGRKWKEIIDVNDKIFYSFHDDSRRERSGKGQGRYNV
ncbi:eukaryotic translation initiation factor [Senna tora]|uniref:Eukaryotic translation initiation factor isoform 4E n=1 Tax=Senna tora TaxID=362788 RepID=A0A834X2T8_9FABA|nr:eukaryotic translation initiation factor [Senna tora]